MRYILLLFVVLVIGCKSSEEEKLAQKNKWKSYQYVSDRYLIEDKNGTYWLAHYNGNGPIKSSIDSKEKVMDYKCEQTPVTSEKKETADVYQDNINAEHIRRLERRIRDLENDGF